jgi:transposase
VRLATLRANQSTLVPEFTDELIERCRGAVTQQGADEGDTTSILDTVTATVEQVEASQTGVDDPPLEEIITDKGYHSNRIMIELDALVVRCYVAEPDRGRRD